jgi:peptide/nickel transport system permease protein
MRIAPRDRTAYAACATLVLMVLLAVLAPLVATVTHHGATQQFLDTGLSASGAPVAPNHTFLLGTDGLGRDVLVRIAYGSRVSMTVGVLASVLAVLVGALVGIAAAWVGGTVDALLSRTIDAFLAFPFVVLALALVAVVGSSLTVSVVVIASFSWASVARVVRSQVLSIREREYVLAARALGANNARIMFVTILPDVMPTLIVYTTLLIPGAIAAEATLSFLGLSVIPPAPSWGNMLADAMRYYRVAWWLVLFPAGAVVATTLACNVVGDRIRDALDPRRGSAEPGGVRAAA